MDFDKIIERKNTNCIKYDSLETLFGNPDLIPLWVADMDFPSPECVKEALTKIVEQGVYGYTSQPEEYTYTIQTWLEKRHNWKIKKDWISFVPGIVKGIAFALDVFSEKGDKIVIQPPVYPPFKSVTEGLGRKVVTNPLIYKNYQYSMDLEGLKNVLKTEKPKVFILCTPHNPGGIVWDRETLSKVADLCAENNVLVISDEIHSDLILPGSKHIPFASISDKAAQNTITFMAPSKTFNIAGLVSSYSIIPNDELRQKFCNYMTPRELSNGTIFAYEGAIAAYNNGEKWLNETIEYINKNIEFTINFFKENIPQIIPVVPRASFLIWLDCRKLNLSQKELVNVFIQKAHLALNDGATFGEEGNGFMRLNIGTSRAILEKALNNLKNALNE